MTKERITIETEVVQPKKDIITSILSTISNLRYQVDHLVDPSPTIGFDTSYAFNNPTVYTATYEFLTALEKVEHKVYNDGKGFKTIGVGFNLDAYGKGDTDTIWRAISSIMQAIGISRNDFEAIYNGALALTDTQVQTLFSVSVRGRLPDGSLVIPVSTTFAGQLNTTLLKGTALPMDMLLPANQLIAIMSLNYNLPGLVGSKLKTAIKDGNQAEAIHQIIEESNLQKNEDGSPKALIHGLANRRISEAAMFAANPGLTLPDSEFWDIVGWARWAMASGQSPNAQSNIFTPTPSDRLDITIQGPVPDFTLPARSKEMATAAPYTIWDAIRRGAVLTKFVEYGNANAKPHMLGTTVADVIDAGAARKRSLDPRQSSTDVELLIGADGNDTMMGSVADTYHEPGTGDDMMSDAGGFDRYFIDINHPEAGEEGEGHDTIDDTMGTGEIHYNAHPIDCSFTARKDGQAGQICDDDVLYMLTPVSGGMTLTFDELPENPKQSVTITGLSTTNPILGFTFGTGALCGPVGSTVDTTLPTDDCVVTGTANSETIDCDFTKRGVGVDCFNA